MRKQYTRIPLSVRFNRKVDRSGGPDACWPWLGSKDRKGYGQIHSGGTEGRLLVASRVAWEEANGPIPAGIQVCHNCPTGDNPACCNPRHLFLGTQAENFADMIAKDRMVRGEQARHAKLTAEEVRQIRARRAAGETLRAIGLRYKVGHAEVHRIATRQRWAHIA